MNSGEVTLESLKTLAADLALRNASGLAATLEPFLEHLRSHPAEFSPKQAVDAVSVACRALFGHGRSAEALPLARELLGHCDRSGDRVQLRRAIVLCGLLSADSVDVVGAIEHYAKALRIAAADEDRLEMAFIWGNIGSAIGVSGRHELSARCHLRCLALLEPVVQAIAARYRAHSNLAHCFYHLDEVDEGLRHGRLALAELEQLRDEDAYGVILLRRNMARLLISRDRIDEAEEHVAQAIVLAAASPSPRAAVAADITRAAHELAARNADIALSRIDRTLARARQIPGTLHDALAVAVRAEESAGFPARALLRLQELSDHVYGHGVEATRRAIEMAGIDSHEPLAEHREREARERLAARLEPPAPPQAWGTLRRLAASAVLRMDDTGWHGVRVGALVKALALAVGLPPLQALETGLAAELHDIGLTSVPAAVLGKRGQLNEGELALVRRHAEGGAAMLVDDPHPRLLLARQIAQYHHARWDGEGYPERVAGVAIPLGARMCAIADAYDAMVCGLAGRPAVTMEVAMAEIRRCSGSQFDPELVSCFYAIVNEGLVGLGLDPGAVHGMESFQELVASLKENRGFV